MNKQHQEAWVKDLRDPNNKQAQCALRRDHGYCCLGRLVIVAGGELVERPASYGTLRRFVIAGTTECLALPLEIRVKTGMKSSTGVLRFPYVHEHFDGASEVRDCEFTLAELNDAGVSFAHIADLIEQYGDEL